MSKVKQPRRWLRFDYDDGTYIDICLTKVTTLMKPLDKVALHIDKIGEDQYLMIANEMLLPEGKKLDKIVVIREEDLDEFDKGGN